MQNFKFQQKFCKATLLGGHKQILGGAQKVQCSKFESVDQKTNAFIANFHNFWGETTKKKGSLLQNLRQKQFLLRNSGGCQLVF